MKEIIWNKLTECKPKYNEEVIVVFDNFVTMGQLLQEDRFGLKFYLTGFQIVLDVGGNNETYKVTHWAYKPKPPKE